MNDEIFRLSLIDVMNEGLLNDFVNDIFGYDFDIKKEEYVYIQYKILGDNVILNIYDNKNNNRFKAYIFTMNDIDNDEDTKYINVWLVCFYLRIIMKKKRLLNLYLVGK